MYIHIYIGRIVMFPNHYSPIMFGQRHSHFANHILSIPTANSCVKVLVPKYFPFMSIFDCWQLVYAILTDLLFKDYHLEILAGMDGQAGRWQKGGIRTAYISINIQRNNLPSKKLDTIKGTNSNKILHSCIWNRQNYAVNPISQVKKVRMGQNVIS